MLTQLSTFWFDLLKDICPNHFITSKIEEMPLTVQKYKDQLQGRSMLIKKVSVLPIEAIVRGYLAGKVYPSEKRKIKNITKKTQQVNRIFKKIICTKMDMNLFPPLICFEFLIGSAWKEYKTTGSVCGITLKSGLQESEKFEKPLFTPSTKAELGSHGSFLFSISFV